MKSIVEMLWPNTIMMAIVTEGVLSKTNSSQVNGFGEISLENENTSK